MIVNEGKAALLEGQDAYLQTCYWFLFEDDETITNATVLSDLTEPVWSGYARVVVGTLSIAAIVAGRAQKTPSVAPVFTNSSGGDVTIYGWGLIAPNGITLIAAVNTGPIVIPAGLSFILSAAITDTQE